MWDDIFMFIADIWFTIWWFWDDDKEEKHKRRKNR